MSAGATPGPWKLAIGGEVRKHGRGTIAECPSPQNGGVMEFVANARLVSVAPDFYQAAKDLLDAELLEDEWDHAMQRLDHAVQKVEGADQ